MLSFFKLALFAMLSVLSGASFATGGVGDIATGISFTDVSTALVTIATAVAAVLVVRKGAKLILGMIR